MNQEKQQTLIHTVASWNQYIREHEISDFYVKKLEREALTLVGGFDLSYYHDIEITITGVFYLNVSTDFYIDLSEHSPFSLCFPSGEGAVLQFRDCALGRQGEIHFDGDILFCTEHVSYG